MGAVGGDCTERAIGANAGDKGGWSIGVRRNTGHRQGRSLCCAGCILAFWNQLCSPLTRVGLNDHSR